MHRLFSVDDHIVEPANVWQDRVPARFKETAPRVGFEGKNQYWYYNGKRGHSSGMFAVAGKAPHEWNRDPMNYKEMIPGCYTPQARARDFLSNGICASVSFPTIAGFGGQLFMDFPRDLASVCVEAYNDFMIDEWCAGGPKGLFVPSVIAKLWDPVEARKEIERCARKGAKALCFIENATGLGQPSFWTKHWDPVWAVCQELDMPICMHIGSVSGFLDLQTAPEAPNTVGASLASLSAQKAAVDFMMSPVLRTFEKLKLVFSEGGIGWIPATMERADRQFLKHKHWSGQSGMLPSEILKRNMYFCMIWEPEGLKHVRHQVGVDRIFWECDYPHADTGWPHAQAEVAEQFAGVPQNEKEAILLGNAERVFNWKAADLPAEFLEAAQ